MENVVMSAKSFCRSSKEFETLDEMFDGLNISKKSRKFIKDKFKGRDGREVVDTLIMRGRMNVTYPGYASMTDAELRKHIGAANAWVELTRAVEREGFVRKPISSMDFRIHKLYKVVYSYPDTTYKNRKYVNPLEGVFLPVGMGDFNCEQYEVYEGLLPEQIDDVKKALKKILTEKEYCVIALGFGLICEERLFHDAIAKQMNLSRERVRQIERKAIRSLFDNRNLLPAIVKSPAGEEEEIAELVNSLNELHKDPIFAVEAELEAKLEEKAQRPFRCAAYARNGLGAKEKIIPESLLDYPVKRIFLCHIFCSDLTANGMLTLKDILECPLEKWGAITSKWPSFHRQSWIETIEEEMHSLGYVSFRIGKSEAS